MKKAEDKTNAIRLAEQKKINVSIHTYSPDQVISGMEVASVLGQNPNHVFKTLVTVGRSGMHYVFVVPVNKELDLKKGASVVNEKSVEMVKSKELLELTGYIHGGCSPIGMKKFFKTTIDESAKSFSTIIFSGGRIGLQMEMSISDLRKLISFTLANITQGWFSVI